MSVVSNIRKRVTTRRLIEMKAVGKLIVCFMAYDAVFVVIFDSSGVEVLFVGDLVGNVI